MKKTDEPLKAIPVDAALIIQVNDYGRLVQNLRKNSVWEITTGIQSLKRIEQQIYFLDSVSRADKNIREILNYNPFYISMHVTGKGKLSFAFVLKMPKGIHEKSINQTIENLVENSGTITSRKYENAEIFDIRLLDKDIVDNFSYTVTKGLLILSFSPLLVEDALRQLTVTESIADDEKFVELLKTVGKNVDANIFLNYHHLPKSAGLYLKSDYRSRLLSGNDFAEWAALDLNLPDEAILLNGFTVLGDSVQQTGSLFLNQSPSKITIDNFLPATITSYISFNLSDVNLYLENYKKQLTTTGRLNDYNKQVTLLKSKYSSDIQDVFYGLVDNEIALAFEAFDSNKRNTNAYVVVNTKSKGHSEKILTDFIDRVAAADRKDKSGFHFNYRIDNELSFAVYKMPYQGFIETFLGGFFNQGNTDYFTFIDNYLVFGESVESLSKFIHANVLNRTLLTDPSYREFKDYLSPRNTVTFYCDLSRSVLNYSEYLLPEVVKTWEENIHIFQKAKVIGFQLSSQRKYLYTSIFMKGVTEYNDKPRTVWESLLDTTVSFKPQFVINHNTRQTEIFVQDEKNNIYLINQVGRILWKQSIPEKIKSGIFQVDYYMNGKLQLLFSTENYLHLIDRNGNYVERYPVKLRSPATNGMALFDYDDNKNYRIFIACEDRQVYAYDKEGNIVKGWSPEKTESEVTQPLNHFRVKDRDYIVFGDNLNTYILDRKGNTRIEVKELIPRSLNNNYYLEPTGELQNSFIAFTDTAGTVYKIFPDERIEKTNLLACTPYHFFDLKDVDGDGHKDFIFLDENKLTVFRHDKTKLFTYDPGVPVDISPVYYHFSANDRKIGLVSKKKCLIFLINSDGSMYKGFPLRGCTQFSIGYLGSTISHFNLITGGDNNFLYNYAVQ
ncbi:MAG: DUF3352 domain-containing protein [Bacteroidales bacterium]|nr:DUF3352 domain-containing protein [Bacteroidales bacterium]